jgi:acyl carrier protein
MTNDEIRQAVLNIIADIAPDEDTSDIKDDKPLRDQIELDSMDFLDIVLELRKRYSVEVPEADYPQLNTLAGCVVYLAPKLKNK